MKILLRALLVLALPLGAAAFAEDANIDIAVNLLEKQVARDEAIVAHPANAVSAREARRQFADGLKDFEFIIFHFNRQFGANEKLMMEDLNRIYAEEKNESQMERVSHRYVEGTRATAERNLGTKKKILEKAKSLLYGPQ